MGCDIIKISIIKYPLSTEFDSKIEQLQHRRQILLSYSSSSSTGNVIRESKSNEKEGHDDMALNTGAADAFAASGQYNITTIN